MNIKVRILSCDPNNVEVTVHFNNDSNTDTSYTCNT